MKKARLGLLFLPERLQNRGSGPGILAPKEKDTGKPHAVIS